MMTCEGTLPTRSYPSINLSTALSITVHCIVVFRGTGIVRQAGRPAPAADQVTVYVYANTPVY